MTVQLTDGGDKLRLVKITQHRSITNILQPNTSAYILAISVQQVESTAKMIYQIIVLFMVTDLLDFASFYTTNLELRYASKWNSLIN